MRSGGRSAMGADTQHPLGEGVIEGDVVRCRGGSPCPPEGDTEEVAVEEKAGVGVGTGDATVEVGVGVGLRARPREGFPRDPSVGVGDDRGAGGSVGPMTIRIGVAVRSRWDAMS